MLNYPYSSGELLQTPQTYRYTPFQGEAFVEAWRTSRLSACRELPAAALPALSASNPPSPIDSIALLSHLCLTLRACAPSAPAEDSLTSYWLPRLLKKFEVSKRLYASYDTTAPHRPVAGSGFEQLQPYLLLAECLIRGWQAHPAGYFFSGLLKLNDTLVSQQARLDPRQGAYLAWILTEEQTMLTQLSKELGL